MTPNGLSPRATKGHHRRARSASNKEELFDGGSRSKKSVTPTPSTSHGRFFNDPVPARSPSTLPTLAASSAASSETVSSSCKDHPKLHLPMRQSTLRLAAMMATALAALLCTHAATASPNSSAATHVRGAAGAETQGRCAKRINAKRGLSAPHDRNQCATLLPALDSHGDSRSWLVAAHVDRAPSTVEFSKRLRGAAQQKRSLPHQYYVRAMEATLHSIGAAEPGAHVDIAVFTEEQWGGMVDEMGLPLHWDVPGEICDDLGLHCTQHVVLMNEPSAPVSEADSLECIAASDVLVASEGSLSKAAAIMSNHVKVLTDRWEMDENEMMVALNPATTIAGMPESQRKLLRTLVADYHECNPSRA